MDSLIALEKEYGTIIAIVTTIVGAVVFKYGYNDYAPSESDVAKEDHKTRGMIMMAVAVAAVGGSWYMAYTYQK